MGFINHPSAALPAAFLLMAAAFATIGLTLGKWLHYG